MKENRVGFTNKTKIGEEYKVVEYNGCNDVIIEFPNGDRKKTTWASVKKGCIAHHCNEFKKKDCVGAEHWNQYLEHFVITKYNKYEDVEVQFDDGTKVACNYDAVKNRYVRNPSHGYRSKDLMQLSLSVPANRTVYKNREGETGINSQGEYMKIIRYFDANHVLVEFEETGYITEASYRNFKKGGIRDVLLPSIYGVACLGDGPYTSSTPIYRRWFDMIRRCYDEKWQEKGSTYIEAEVCPEWLNFQNFAPWYEEHFNPNMPNSNLDKDLLGRGQKYYSPETCCFLPSELNALITKNEKIRGDYPIGVTVDPLQPNKYISRLTDNNGNQTYRFYKACDSVEEAFQLYKQEKEKWIKEQAEKFKNVLEPRAYEALINWEVREDD